MCFKFHENTKFGIFRLSQGLIIQPESYLNLDSREALNRLVTIGLNDSTHQLCRGDDVSISSTFYDQLLHQ